MNKYIFKCYLFIFVFFSINALNIKTFINDTDIALDVYNDNHTLPNFTYASSSCCQSHPLYIDQSNYDITNFTIFTDENEVVDKDNILITYINSNLDISSQKEVFSLPEHDNIIELQIIDICKLNQSFYDGNIISITLKVNEEDITFTYSKTCSNKSNSPYMKKCLSIIILLMIIYFIVFIASKFSPKQNFLSNNILNAQLRAQCDIQWHYGIYIIILSMVIVWCIHSFENITINLCSFFITVISFVLLYMGIAYLTKKSMKFECFNKRLKERIKEEYFNCKLYKILSMIISIVILILFKIFRSVFISNIILFSIIFGGLSLLITTNFYSLILFCSCFISYDIFFIISSFIFHVNYSTKALEMLDQPYKLVIPNIIKYDPIHPCLFSSYIDIILIGLIVKYTRSFDLLKGYTNYKYFTMSLILLGLGCLGTFLFYLLYSSEQILLFPIMMIEIADLILYSFYQGEFTDFMEGKNNIGVRKAVDDIIHSVEKIDDDDEEDKVKYERKGSDDE